MKEKHFGQIGFLAFTLERRPNMFMCQYRIRQQSTISAERKKKKRIGKPTHIPHAEDFQGFFSVPLIEAIAVNVAAAVATVVVVVL